MDYSEAFIELCNVVKDVQSLTYVATAFGRDEQLDRAYEIGEVWETPVTRYDSYRDLIRALEYRHPLMAEALGVSRTGC